MLIVWTALLGLVVGSFLNVCIYRIPRQESVAFPASHCPACGTPIRVRDNIPLLSFLLLRGRCRSCRAPIPWRYPLVEALTGGLFAATLACWGVSWEALSLLLLLSALIVVTFVDLDHQIIPNIITLPGIPIGLLAGLLVDDPPMLDRILGTLIGAGFLYLVLYYGSVIYGQDAMGEGDLNLLAMIGAFLGWRAVLVTVLVSCLSGSLVGLALIGAKRLTRREHIPFGPFLCLGAVVAIFAGESLIAWYLQRLR